MKEAREILRYIQKEPLHSLDEREKESIDYALKCIDIVENLPSEEELFDLICVGTSKANLDAHDYGVDVSVSAKAIHERMGK